MPVDDHPGEPVYDRDGACDMASLPRALIPATAVPPAPPAPPAPAKRDGALDRPADIFLRRVIHRHLRAAHKALCRLEEKNPHGDAEKGRAESLHEYRVNIRRTRSLLRAARRVLGKRAVRSRHLGRLRASAQITNEGRDFDVHRIWLQAALRKSRPVPLRRGLEHLASPAAAQADAIPLGALKRTVKRLARKVDARLKQGRSTEDPVSAGQCMMSMLHREAQRFAARLDAAWATDDLDAMHAARLQAKRLRYVLEPLQGHGVRARPALRALRRLQDDFGQVNDLSTLRDRAVEAVDQAATAWIRTLLASDRAAARSARHHLRAAVAAARWISRALNRKYAALRRRWTADRRAGVLDRTERVLIRLRAGE